MSSPFRSTQLIQLIYTGLYFLLGLGIVQYLGARIDWVPILFGLLIVLFIKISTSLLHSYFLKPFGIATIDGSRASVERARNVVLSIALALFAVAGTLAVLLVVDDRLSLAAGFVLLGIGLSFIVCVIPPFKLLDRGYGEIVMALSMAMLVPAFSFLLFANEFHRLIWLIPLPLTMQLMAWLISEEFATFADDVKTGRMNLLQRLSWQKAIPIHQIFVLTAYFLFSAFSFLGVPWRVVWPVLLSFPFAVLQIVWMQRIADGHAPVWKFFRLLTAVPAGLATYLLALSFLIQ